MIETQIHFVPSTRNRLMARWLDQVFIWMVLAPILMMFPMTEEGWIQLSLPCAVALFLYPIFYEAFCTYFFYTTPGKWICNLKLVPVESTLAKNWGVHALTRAVICHFGNFFWAIFATAFFRYDRRHLADWICETRVVGLAPTGFVKIRPVIGIIVVILGCISGWVSTYEQVTNIDYEDGFIYIPDPTNYDFSNIEDEIED